MKKRAEFSNCGFVLALLLYVVAVCSGAGLMVACTRKYCDFRGEVFATEISNWLVSRIERCPNLGGWN